MQRNARTADGTNFQILVGFERAPSLYRNIRSLQQQNAVLNEIGKSVRNSEQNPPAEPWEDATCAQGLEYLQQSLCQRFNAQCNSFGPKSEVAKSSARN